MAITVHQAGDQARVNLLVAVDFDAIQPTGSAPSFRMRMPPLFSPESRFGSPYLHQRDSAPCDLRDE
jgi:hypothetical protein